MSAPKTGTDAKIDEARKIVDATPAQVMQRLASDTARELRHDRDLLVDALLAVATDLPQASDVEYAASGAAKLAEVVAILGTHADSLDELTAQAEEFQEFAAGDVRRAEGSA